MASDPMLISQTIQYKYCDPEFWVYIRANEYSADPLREITARPRQGRTGELVSENWWSAGCTDRDSTIPRALGQQVRGRREVLRALKGTRIRSCGSMEGNSFRASLPPHRTGTDHSPTSGIVDRKARCVHRPSLSPVPSARCCTRFAQVPACALRAPPCAAFHSPSLPHRSLTPSVVALAHFDSGTTKPIAGRIQAVFLSASPPLQATSYSVNTPEIRDSVVVRVRIYASTSYNTVDAHCRFLNCPACPDS